MAASVLMAAAGAAGQTAQKIGVEVSPYERLEDGEQFEVSRLELLRRGELLFRGPVRHVRARHVAPWRPPVATFRVPSTFASSSELRGVIRTSVAAKRLPKI